MKPAKNSSNKIALRWLFKRVGAARIWILLSVGLGLGSGILLIFQARYLALIVHGVLLQKRTPAMMGPFFGVLISIFVLRAALGWAREITGFYAGKFEFVFISP